MMYAFSRACMVFTTANSSAMLSYLRGVCPSGGHQGPQNSGHSCGGTLRLAQPDPSSPRPSVWAWGSSLGAGLTFPAPVRSCTASLPVRERGSVGTGPHTWVCAAGGCPPGRCPPLTSYSSGLFPGAATEPGAGRPVHPPWPLPTPPPGLCHRVCRGMGMLSVCGETWGLVPHSTTALQPPHSTAG